jgi:hypothetical protein
MPLDLFQPLVMTLVAVAVTFAVSVLVGMVLGQRLRDPEATDVGRPALPTRPPGG